MVVLLADGGVAGRHGGRPRNTVRVLRVRRSQVLQRPHGVAGDAVGARQHLPTGRPRREHVLVLEARGLSAGRGSTGGVVAGSPRLARRALDTFVSSVDEVVRSADHVAARRVRGDTVGPGRGSVGHTC